MAIPYLVALLLQFYFLNLTVALPQGAFATTTISNGTCNGCEIAISETFLTYPTPVSVTISQVTKTIIPYVTQYANGTNITNLSTYTKFSQNATAQNTFVEPSTTALTWQTLGTTLTYPTTYAAFVEGAAGTSETLQIGTATFCQAPTLTKFAAPTIDLQHLIFPLVGVNGSDAEFQTQAFKYHEDLATVTEVLGGSFNPHSCKVSAVLVMGTTAPNPGDGDDAVGGGGGSDPGKGSTANGHGTDDVPNGGDGDNNTPPTAAVTHTSVAVLTSWGNPIVTSIAAPAPPAQAVSSAAEHHAANTDLLEPINSFLTSLFNNQAPKPTATQDPLSSFFSVLGIDPDAPATSPVPAGALPIQTSTSNANAGSSKTGAGGNSNILVGQGITVGSTSDKMSNQVIPVPNSGNLGGQALAQVSGTSGAAMITPAPQLLKPAQQPVTIGSNVVSVAQASNGNGVVLGGIVTLAAGASTKVNGVMVSVAATGGALIIGSSTVAVTASGYVSSTYVPVVTLGSSTFTANAQGAFIVAGQTITAGGAVTVAGNFVSLAKSGGVAVVNGHTATLSSALVSITVKAVPSGTGVAAAMATATGMLYDDGSSGRSTSSTDAGKSEPGFVKAINSAPKHSSFIGVVGSIIAVGVAVIALV